VSPLFSVVIPTYNRSSLLERALDSVRRQTFTDYEVIVVDDGSADGTANYLASLGTRIRTIRQQNQGPAAARNAGAKIARGEYLAFLDSDDLWFPWTIASFAEVLRHEDIAMLQACWLDFREDPEHAQVRPELLRGRRYRNYLEASTAGGIHLGAGRMVVRRRDFEEAQGFDARLHCAEENDLALRLGLVPVFFAVTARCQTACRRHAHSATHDFGASADGVRAIIEREKRGGYPGGAQHRADRVHLIARTVRPVSVACLGAHRWRDAWRLFNAILPWSLREARWKYLVGFPMLALWRRVVDRGALRVHGHGA
jgi:hypothetical protein